MDLELMGLREVEGSGRSGWKLGRKGKDQFGMLEGAN
jgi:hypothetical protein